MDWTQNYIMYLMDVVIWMYVMPSGCGFGPEHGNGRLATLPGLSSNNILLAHAPLWTTDEPVEMWMLSSSGNMSVAWYATDPIAVRGSSPQVSSFWSIVEDTSPWDTNSETAWQLPARRLLTWHSLNGLGFAPICWKLLYRVRWMRHREPADAVTLKCWMGEQGVAAEVEAEEGPYGNHDWLLPATPEEEGSDWTVGMIPLWANR